MSLSQAECVSSHITRSMTQRNIQIGPTGHRAKGWRKACEGAGRHRTVCRTGGEWDGGIPEGRGGHTETRCDTLLTCSQRVSVDGRNSPEVRMVRPVELSWWRQSTADKGGGSRLEKRSERISCIRTYMKKTMIGASLGREFRLLRLNDNQTAFESSWTGSPQQWYVYNSFYYERIENEYPKTSTLAPMFSLETCTLIEIALALIPGGLPREKVVKNGTIKGASGKQNRW